MLGCNRVHPIVEYTRKFVEGMEFMYPSKVTVDHCGSKCVKILKSGSYLRQEFEAIRIRVLLHEL